VDLDAMKTERAAERHFGARCAAQRLTASVGSWTALITEPISTSWLHSVRQPPWNPNFP